MCFGTNEKYQRYYCIDCIITSAPYRENAIIGAISNNDLLKLGMSSHKYGSWVEALNPVNSYNKIKKENDITFSNDCLKTKFLLTWNQVHLGRDRGAQVWTRLAHLRDTSINFKNARKNDGRMLSLLHFLSLEVYGDKVQTLLLVVKYYQAINQYQAYSTNQLQQKYTELLSTKEEVVLAGDSFKALLIRVDEVFKSAMQKCYTTFCSISDHHIFRNFG